VNLAVETKLIEVGYYVLVKLGLSLRQPLTRHSPRILSTELQLCCLKRGCQVVGFVFHLILRYYDYSVECSQYEGCCALQHVQRVNKLSSFKTILIFNNAQASRVYRNTFDVMLTFPVLDMQQTFCQFWAEELEPALVI